MTSGYTGPVALGASKYAIPGWAKSPSLAPAQPLHALVPNGKPSQDQQQPAQQSASVNPDAELAIAQGAQLKEDVLKYSSSFANSVSSAITNTHRLLALLRVSAQTAGNAADKELLDGLWKELERLFAAAKDAQAQLPQFLEKQNQNARLYHGAMAQEAMKNVDAELAEQHHKVQIQHTLILDHQQAFNDYKLQAKATSEELSKAKEKITELQERVSRLTLDKGLYKTEIENYKRQLEDLRSTHAEVTAANAKLQEAVETAEAAAKKSQGEASLQNTQKQANLEKRIEELLKNEGVVKKELIQLRAEYGSLQQKFKNQGEEHSKLFAETKNIHKLTAEIAELKNKNAEQASRLQEMQELQKTNADLSTSKAELEKKIESLEQVSVKFAKQGEELKKLTKENEALEIEQQDLAAELAQHKEKVVELETLRAENEALKKSSQQSTEVRGTPVDADLEAQLQESKAELEQWKVLAERSYNEYKSVLPGYKQSEGYRKACEEKDEEIAKLKAKLGSGGAMNGNNLDANFWKTKYDNLLAQFNRR